MINLELNNIKLEFETSDKVFSPSNIDKGTLAMLSQVEFNKNDKILDLGCGYGIVGIFASKLIGAENVIMCDLSPDAVELSKSNATNNGIIDLQIIQSDGLDNITDNNFSLILSNPPYHVDFSVPKKFIEQSYKRLITGGKMYMVTKRKDWYKNKLISVFGGVVIVEIDGYYVFMAEKRNEKKVKIEKTSTLSKKLQRKQVKTRK
ncbi:class I SAM-dependent methyltransferase [Clostridium gasigenes]|uniref:class I SAM-dependent methyltransferase n=1 Tax=Clostridium gasigenes TaxID=94869 RepID=UPI0014382E72|nr:methyltransferase [Clostridium gasigenes]MBU3105751.1 methyltransferase [Clostridium gasigenes]MBU3137493.1 methyltransferase [Clostridium gasigenes]NKF08029.1 methyltransferase [Clostridium gasigenes]QSW20595.1 methyltransferase [Clostridium gasigenes]